MRLGFREIVATVVLAATSCAEKSGAVQSALQTADQKVVDEFYRTLQFMTYRFELAIRQQCSLEGSLGVAAGNGSLDVESIPDQVVRNAENGCLRQAGINPVVSPVLYKYKP